MKYLVRYLLPLAAVGLFGVALFHVAGNRAEEAEPPPVRLSAPPESPFENSVAGAGVIEPQSEAIAIGSSSAGLVKKVLVQVGDRVEPEKTLFELDDRELQAQLAVEQAALASAEAELERLKAQPRLEEVPVKEALAAEAAASLEERRRDLERVRRLYERGAASDSERDDAQAAYEVGQAQLKKAKAELALLNAGAWQSDIRLAEAAVLRAATEVQRVKTQLALLKVKAPIGGQILQVDVRPGEFVATPAPEPLIVMGATKTLHVRVDIDEQDIPRFKPATSAVARLRGGSDQTYALDFVRIEPYVVPKRSLTGDNTERIDTRVLQVIYKVQDPGENLYVGQQVDVFVNTSKK